MTIRMRTFLACDVPRCVAEAAELQLQELPLDWTRVCSTTHLGKAAGLARLIGSFTLHVCPRHRDVFANHHPMTTGHGVRAGHPRLVDVGCECGAQFGRIEDGHISGYRFGNPARAWFGHLPGRLKANAQQVAEWT